MDKSTEKMIVEAAEKLYKEILRREVPMLDFPMRSLENVTYDKKKGFFEIGDRVVERTLSYNTIKTFAQTVRMMALSHEIVKKNDMATKREAYYVSKNWGDARFTEQPESDTIMDDIEAHFRLNREKLGFIPEEKGGDIVGKLVVIDQDPNTGEFVRQRSFEGSFFIGASYYRGI